MNDHALLGEPGKLLLEIGRKTCMGNGGMNGCNRSPSAEYGFSTILFTIELCIHGPILVHILRRGGRGILYSAAAVYLVVYRAAGRCCAPIVLVRRNR